MSKHWQSLKAVSLLELLLVLVVVTIIIVSLTLYFEQDKQNTLVQEASDQVVSIDNAVQNYVASVSTVYASFNALKSANVINLDTLINIGLLTDLYRTSPWGKPVTIGLGAANYPNCEPGPAYFITMTTNSASSCQKLIDSVQQTGLASAKIACANSNLTVNICLNLH